jgi:precorrin-4/cobalt-precorrin-4 C11-methyltransferase
MAELVSEKCMSAGLSPDTPAAWIYRATWEDERMCVTTLGNLPKSMKDAGIDKHALIIVGECLERGIDSRSLLYSPGFRGENR